MNHSIQQRETRFLVVYLIRKCPVALAAGHFFAGIRDLYAKKRIPAGILFRLVLTNQLLAQLVAHINKHFQADSVHCV